MTHPNNIFEFAIKTMAQAREAIEKRADLFTEARNAAFAPVVKAPVVRKRKIEIVSELMAQFTDEVQAMLSEGRSVEYVCSWVGKRTGQTINPWLARKYLLANGLRQGQERILGVREAVEQNKTLIQSLLSEDKKLKEIAEVLGVKYNSLCNYRNMLGGAV